MWLQLLVITLMSKFIREENSLLSLNSHFRVGTNQIFKANFHVDLQSFRVVAQPGSAFAWGARGRWFESSPPDTEIRVVIDGLITLFSGSSAAR
jgi:hypothetical protein